MSLNELKKELSSLADKKQALILSRFFKTGRGEYGEGDVFLGIKVPMQRKVAAKYAKLGLKDIKALLGSKIHEYRLVGLVILVNKYKEAEAGDKKKFFDFYIKNTGSINNWDLVDITCHHIVGDYLAARPRTVLYKLARSKDLWEKRIAIISTFAFIRNNDFNDTLKISEILLPDEHDLIHKAVGWMLREVGKRDQKTEEEFLIKHYKTMPRTMLRYAIERFPDEKRKFYMKK